MLDHVAPFFTGEKGHANFWDQHSDQCHQLWARVNKCDAEERKSDDPSDG